LNFARDPAALAALKAKLKYNRDTQPLFDTACFTRNLEAAYANMWQRVRNGAAPADFAVAPAPAS
jgi:predicted O-linked N-acetylglucosamine transferase (SPINDLY family)